ncbi:polysaccharide deacetylase family protein [Actinomycetospora cinnamomea]|uniref:Peptidoglycan/xylan/chitin deacetylase (PgdA/CDA1 family) n=1 Tax=Actinomycetospora cinnamomea TaxID=663609 RepID=A0A2U1EZM6_9PSEU|nr:polysaccharide deacetylase family protein [Actinomycetospora cinnamomea]PVZ05393.1 peptidoglycan/xylan/chitin deacetylase (PgdA/CDA1 family) [Actinomycetospora cinnamomea]
MTLLTALGRSVGPVLSGRVLFSLPTRAPRFALTVDDGPSPATTPALLDALARHGARASFFLLGDQAEAHPDLVARIAADGHELGNHTWRDEPTWTLPVAEFREKLHATQRVLTAHGPVRWFRPGSGWPTEAHLAVAEQVGLRCVLGSAAAIDGSGAGGPRSARLLDLVVRRGTIVVLHEGTPGRRAVAATVDALLARTARRGLAAVTLSELAG